MELATAVGGKIVLALVVLIVGSAVIKKAVKLVSKSRTLNKVEGTVRSFVMSFVKIGLYVILVISIIGILGVPMASVVAVLASAGVAVGLALQGALSNLAGGIMLMIFHPFRQGDYIEAAGVDGVVQEVTLFYTVLLSLDDKRITVPNGSLMNANVVNYSSEALRRVDLTFACAKSEAPAQIQDLMMDVVKANGKVLADPAPFARLNGGTNEAMEFTVRAWTKGEDYWDVYFDLTQAITEAMGAKGVQAPAVRVVTQ
jgi:small conductance mechanosensitive channel